MRVCDGFEDEAWAAAAQVLDHRRSRRDAPSRSIAHDRVLVRRVRRAARARRRVASRDETGWKLATTRAGASVMSLLAGGAADRKRRRLPRLAQVRAAESRQRARRARSKRSRPAARRRRRSPTRSAAARPSSEARRVCHARRRPRDRSTRSRGHVATPPCRRGSMPCAAALERRRRARAACATTPLAGRRSPRSASSPPLAPCAARASSPADLEPMTAGRIHALGRRRSRARRPSCRRMPLPRTQTRMPRHGPARRRRSRRSARSDAASVRCRRSCPARTTARLGAMTGRRFAPAAQRRRRRCTLADAGGIVRDGELLAFAQLLRLPCVTTLLRRRGDGADPVAATARFVERLATPRWPRCARPTTRWAI